VARVRVAELPKRRCCSRGCRNVFVWRKADKAAERVGSAVGLFLGWMS